MSIAMDVNLQAASVIEDPFPVYERIRAAGRVVRNDLMGLWMIPGYEDVLSVLHTPRTYSSAFHDPGQSPAFFEGARTMIDSDPPDHHRLRAVAKRAFIRPGVTRIESTITRVVDDCLDGDDFRERVAGGQPVEVMSSFCRQIPGTVIALLLGIPVSDISLFVSWSEDLGAAAGVNRGTSDDWPAVFRRAEQSGLAMADYLKDQIRRRRSGEEHDDLINDLLLANDSGTLDDRELIATCILLLIAGNETTTKLIGIGLRLLHEHADQRRELVARPALMAGAVEELLRFQGVTHVQGRIATEDTAIAGVPIRVGEIVMVLFAAANRDPAAWSVPSRFDLHRTPNRHVGFGHGVHHCLGAALARAEARIALNGFLRRWPNYAAGEYNYGPVLLARGFDSLYLTIRPS